MRFSIRHAMDKDLSVVNLIDEQTGTEIAILPGFGASLHAFRVHKPGAGNDHFNIIDNYRDLAEVRTEMARSFKSPKLSPFPCRMAGGQYHFDGHTYRFARLFGDGTAIHGLLYDKSFAVTKEETGDSSAGLGLQYAYRQDDEAYPFAYDCDIKYILHPGNLLEVQTKLTNRDDRTMPMADGWHPYFRLGGRIEDWWLQFNAASIVEFDDRLIPTGRLPKYDTFNKARLIGHTQLDNCFLLQKGKTNPACEIYNPSNGLRISFCTDETYPYLQIYTPPGRESIAVENLSGAPDCFNNNMGLLLLAPGHSQTFTINYKVNIG